ncbi:MAG: sn-glycerol-3-phosphate ABC transporter ATP-binding protein UgpC [Rhodoferax sp.]|uniref:ABC transporter ATP-binding protein n=1 Tax=Rhodoferax sp. TaxID=50421 RepID=UPI003264DFBF
MTQITLQSIQKNYAGSVQVIRDVDLDIAAGEFCVFLGPSGCGKSTLLRMIAGIESITAGDLHIGGVHMNEVPPAEREVAMVFQNYALYPHMSLYENMAFGLRQAKVDKAEIHRRVSEAAEVLQITHMLDRLPKALSGGQRQRVAIGRAIVRRPNVFLFDEPLSNLDAALRVHMRTEIARLHRDFQRASAVYVTHDQTEAMALADKIVLLRAGEGMLTHGSIAQVGAPLDLYHHPRDMFVASFLGSPRMNFLPATVQAVDDHTLTLQTDASAGGERLQLPRQGRRVAAGARVTLGIRPEHLLPGDMGGATLLRTVQQVEHFGEYSYVYLQGLPGEPLIAKVPGRSSALAGDRTPFTVPDPAYHLFDDASFAIAAQ